MIHIDQLISNLTADIEGNRFRLNTVKKRKATEAKEELHIYKYTVNRVIPKHIVFFLTDNNYIKKVEDIIR